MTHGCLARAAILLLVGIFGIIDHACAVSDGTYVGQIIVDAGSAPGCRPGAIITTSNGERERNHLHFTWGKGIVKFDIPADSGGSFSDTQRYDSWGGGGGFVPDTLNVSGVAAEQTISAQMHTMYCRYSVRLVR